MFLAVEEAAGVPYAPLSIGILERSYSEIDPGAIEHIREVQARLVPAMTRRIVHDRWSLALPRWVDVEGYDLTKQSEVLPVPGDGSMRAILDWAAEYAGRPFTPGLAPWRTVYFENVSYEGRDGCTVMVSQTHHSVIDGEGGRRIGQKLLQFEPDGPLPEMPPEVPQEHISAFGRWTEGWALEAHKLRLGLQANYARAAWATRHPKAGLRPCQGPDPCAWPHAAPPSRDPKERPAGPSVEAGEVRPSPCRPRRARRPARSLSAAP